MATQKSAKQINANEIIVDAEFDNSVEELAMAA